MNPDLLVLINPAKVGRGKWGTGYRIRRGIVLTAAHVVGDVGSEVRLQLHGSVEPVLGHVVFRQICGETALTNDSSSSEAVESGDKEHSKQLIVDEDDVALIRFDPPAGDRVSPSVTLSEAPFEGTPEMVAGGWPRAGTRRNLQQKEPNTLTGEAHQSRTGVTCFSIRAADLPNLTKNISRNREAVPDWFGLSGAPVFVDGKLCGVVRRLARGFEDRLVASSITHLAGSHDDFRRLVGLVSRRGNRAVLPPNFGSDRFVRIVSKDRRFLGNGFKITPDWVITAHELVVAEDGVCIDERYRYRFRPRPARVAWPREGEERDDGDVVLLEATVPNGERLVPFSRFAEREPLKGEVWRCLGYCRGDEDPHERRQLSGTVESSTEGVSLLFLDGRAPSSEQLRRWLGAAVFVDRDDTGSWCLLGVLGIEGAGEEVRPVARAVKSLCAWQGFAQEYDRAAEAARHLGNVDEVARCLGVPDLRKEVLRHASPVAWTTVGTDPRALATALCSETEPDELAEALCTAFCHLTERDKDRLADDVFTLLMWSLPVALASRWQFELPEPSSTAIRLELPYRVLIDFVLAAADGARSEFWELPENADSDLPPATHEIAHPGELGADPDGHATSGALADDIFAHLALDVGLDAASQKEAKRFYASMASRRYGRGRHGAGELLFEREDYKRVKSLPQASHSKRFFEVLNRRMAKGTSQGRRHYFVAKPDTMHLEPGIAERLPYLKRIEYRRSSIDSDSFDDVIDALRSAFRQRTLRARSQRKRKERTTP